MKKNLINACRLMTTLMLAGAGGYAHAQDTVTVTFNLKAEYSAVTCEQNLLTDGNSADTTVDFGTFSQDTPSTSKSVVLTLKCESDLPDKVKVGFSVSAPATVDGSITNRLYPSPSLSAPGESAQKILYYDWVWGDGINNTVKPSVVNGSHKTLHSGEKIDLKGNSADDVYEVVPDGHAVYELTFPLKITRNVDTNKIAQLTAGEYTAAVTVNVSYE